MSDVFKIAEHDRRAEAFRQTAELLVKQPGKLGALVLVRRRDLFLPHGVKRFMLPPPRLHGTSI